MRTSGICTVCALIILIVAIVGVAAVSTADGDDGYLPIVSSADKSSLLEIVYIPGSEFMDGSAWPAGCEPSDNCGVYCFVFQSGSSCMPFKTWSP